MKKHVIVFGLLFFSVVSFGQNTNIFPLNGNVGIGTITPLTRLEVLATGTIPATQNIGYFGSITKELTINSYAGLFMNYNATTSFPTSYRSFKLQYVSGQNTSTTFNKGFIEFNRPATTNTTISAISFGNSDIEFMRINQNGKVRIGNGANDIKTPDGYKLFVEEGILTEKVKVAVKTTGNWADYVFNEEYSLMPLNEVEAFVKENKHLPNVPSATEMVENGLDVAQMDAKLLEKVEELTLYIIEQNKQIEELKVAVQILMEKK
ncbi:hypothetical protein J2X31_002399 [Flavobacterium arsenatis]|uniref:BZIP transcription factor n=1 Tax=Flavobacterium arsenatis TaxID=1484332 RepID=A0ABU1TQW5_9FLAO|nr:hypothetical protein [Flavobacterium arsenatis]MDR6968376.1 hypothetical protein [Flavobacterium arsenatis]